MTTTPISDATLHAFLDGQLDNDTERRVLAYLEANPGALERFQRHADQKHLLADDFEALAGETVDPETEALAARLSDRLERADRRQRHRRWLAGVAVASLLLIVGWVGHVSFEALRAAGLPAFVADAAQDHLLFVHSTRPVEIEASEQSLLEQVSSDHLGEAVDVPSLAAHGYDLIGGRLLGAQEGPFVQFLYDDGADHPMTLYLARQTASIDDGVHLAVVDGLQAAYWRTKSLIYALIGDVAPNELRAIADTIAEAQR